MSQYTQFLDGEVQIGQSAYISNYSKIDHIEFDWWRCKKCGTAIGDINSTTKQPQMTCYRCGEQRESQ
jgi:ABC-type ATPase with predicted acetyltransferase domain